MAVAGSMLGAILILGSGLAATQSDAAGLAVLGLAYAAAAWVGVWALATDRWAVAAVCIGAEAVGFLLIAEDGFPTIPAAVATLLLGGAATVRSLRRSRAPD